MALQVMVEVRYRKKEEGVIEYVRISAGEVIMN